MNITSTLKKLLHAVNLIGEDQDVLVDGYGTLAVCPPVRMTNLAHIISSTIPAEELGKFYRKAIELDVQFDTNIHIMIFGPDIGFLEFRHRMSTDLQENARHLKKQLSSNISQS